MDFVTDLPETMASGFTGMKEVVDRLTKMAIFNVNVLLRLQGGCQCRWNTPR